MAVLPVERIDVLGVGVHALEPARLMDAVAELVERGGATVAYANVHVLNVAARDAELRRFLGAADLCYCDGNGVVLASRILGRPLPGRMTGADWIWDLAARAEAEGWRVYWIGGRPGVTARAAARLRERHPRLEIATDHGFHPREGPEDEASLARIDAFDPHVVLVGMGTPEQERWVAARRARIRAPVVWCLGATADFVAGEVPRPGPRWLVEHHEWLSRLLADPRRLWRRYLVGNTVFLGRVLARRITGGARARSPAP